VAAYFVLFAPFVVNLKYGNHFLTPLWSVGVEEMYYLGWAPVVKLLRRNLLAVLAATITVKLLLAVWAHWYNQGLAQEVLRLLQFEAMAVGGLGACFVFHRQKPLHTHWLFSKPVQVPYPMVFDDPVCSPFVMMALFAWSIINAAVNERSIVRLDSRLLNYLGDISYGIYMYHALVISLVFVPFLDVYGRAPYALNTVVLHLLVAAFTFGLAALSKRFFEDRLLTIKGRFQPRVLPTSAQFMPANNTAHRPDSLAA
jgi:peptidoglycan/LPS O-acetylase OafA/YrhL